MQTIALNGEAQADATPTGAAPSRKDQKTLANYRESIGRKRTAASIQAELDEVLSKLPGDLHSEAVAIADEQRRAKGLDQKTAKREALAILHGGDAEANCRLWCHIYVFLALAFSAYLNGYCNAHSQHVVSGSLAPWLLGAVIPFFVFTLSKVAGKCHKTGNNIMATVIGVACLGGLIVSLWECQYSINLLMHFPTRAMAVGLAVFVDIGIVGCELAALGVCSPKKQ